MNPELQHRLLQLEKRVSELEAVIEVQLRINEKAIEINDDQNQIIATLRNMIEGSPVNDQTIN